MRTITAFYDNRTEAEEAKARLTSSNIEANRINIIDQTSGGISGSKQQEPGQQGFMASLKELFMPEEDTHAYGEGIRRGGYMLCAHVHQAEADEAIKLLEQTNSVDFDRRQEEWRSEGWTGRTEGLEGRTTAGLGATPQTSGGRTVEEEHIPLVEEEMRVGKREVSRGGARVRSYIRETPVHEEVNLREEHVSVERRPVDEKLGRGALDRDGDLLRERSVEMTERSEEAVVEKEARVREELVVRKTAEEHVEQIDDTVRRTEVDIDEGGTGREAGTTDRSAFASFGGERIAKDGERASDGSREREVEGSGYSPRIDKSGL